ncbi:hypothetical protein [Cyanobium sp. Morenito 9A2]|uniref:hypothetical protein n=1 Tax=Cyanobium sp. Morenito 9A2 TaxID=2823718 RepID=UPI0020CB76F2|nr:hypothetical protein [Cyanobium sp. Morenito 9A2]MCP9851040.1 hypothetical protein [Cyanobium sp. Morenito 9A2]
MANKLWEIFVKHLWPLLWPIIRDLMTHFAQDLSSWIKKAVSDRFEKSSAEQQQRASERATSAENRAHEATSSEERVRAQAEANAWKEIAEELKQDNAVLKRQLDEVITQSQVYARKRIDSEAEKGKVEERILSIRPPSES